MSVIGTIPQYTIPAEPPNKSIVGWGDPVDAVYVRLDDQAEGFGQPDERWFEATDPALDSPLSWQAACDANGSSGQPYLLNRQPLPAAHHVPKNLVTLSALTDDIDPASPDEATQFAILVPSGLRRVYGDQSWVAYGQCLEEQPDSRIQRRDITISYGQWEDHHG